MFCINKHFILFAPFKRSVATPEQQCITISIISDECIEDDETFHLQLSTTDESVMLNPATTYVTILNNDCKFLRPSLSKVHKNRLQKSYRLTANRIYSKYGRK